MEILLVTVSCLLVSARGLHLPNYIKACSSNSPNFEQCAIRNGNEAISHIVKGDRTYGIQSFQPYRIPFLTISFNGLDMNLTDASFAGVENLRMQEYKLDPVKKTTSVLLKGPMIKFEFDYNTKGQIASLPIEGNGHGWAEFYNINYTYTYDFEVKTKNNKHYMVVGKDVIKIEPESVKCKLDNLFNGNKQLGDNLNQVLNENWRDLLTEFGPVVSQINSAIVKDLLGSIYGKVPLEDIYPDIVW